MLSGVTVVHAFAVIADRFFLAENDTMLSATAMAENQGLGNLPRRPWLGTKGYQGRLAQAQRAMVPQGTFGDGTAAHSEIHAPEPRLENTLDGPVGLWPSEKSLNRL